MDMLKIAPAFSAFRPSMDINGGWFAPAAVVSCTFPGVCGFRYGV
jgi:hypothetical protein